MTCSMIDVSNENDESTHFRLLSTNNTLHFCHLLITFANSLDKMSVLIWIYTVCHSVNIPEKTLEKNNFKNSQQMTTKA